MKANKALFGAAALTTALMTGCGKTDEPKPEDKFLVVTGTEGTVQSYAANERCLDVNKITGTITFKTQGSPHSHTFNLNDIGTASDMTYLTHVLSQNKLKLPEKDVEKVFDGAIYTIESLKREARNDCPHVYADFTTTSTSGSTDFPEGTECKTLADVKGEVQIHGFYTYRDGDKESRSVTLTSTYNADDLIGQSDVGFVKGIYEEFGIRQTDKPERLKGGTQAVKASRDLAKEKCGAHALAL